MKKDADGTKVMVVSGVDGAAVYDLMKKLYTERNTP
jgi:hypothetical protein